MFGISVLKVRNSHQYRWPYINELWFSGRLQKKVWKTKERNSYQYNIFSFLSVCFIQNSQQLCQLRSSALKDRRLCCKNIEILTSGLSSTMEIIVKPLELAECFFSYLFLSSLHAHPTSEQKNTFRKQHFNCSTSQFCPVSYLLKSNLATVSKTKSGKDVVWNRSGTVGWKKMLKTGIERAQCRFPCRTLR